MSSLKKWQQMKRLFDVTLAVIALLVFLIPIGLIALWVKLTSKGTVLYWSERIGVGNTAFEMPKFRSMKTDTPTVATHLLTDPKSALTPIGGFLRKTSLDELPQLWCILIGEMSFVGPRPALYNQNDLVLLRTRYGIDSLHPGLTGWAQINGRDELSIPKKVALDLVYLKQQSLCFDSYIVYQTIKKVIYREGINH